MCLRTWHSSSGHSEHTMYTHRVSHLNPHTQCTHTSSQSPQASHTMYTHTSSQSPQASHTHNHLKPHTQCAHRYSQSPEASHTTYTCSHIHTYSHLKPPPSSPTPTTTLHQQGSQQLLTLSPPKFCSKVDSAPIPFAQDLSRTKSLVQIRCS